MMWGLYNDPEIYAVTFKYQVYSVGDYKYIFYIYIYMCIYIYTIAMANYISVHVCAYIHVGMHEYITG